MNAPREAAPRRPYGLWLAGLALYAAGLTGQRFGDDLGFLLPEPGRHPFFHFLAPHPHHPWYRPIEASVLLCAQALSGGSTVPVHLLHLGLHLGLVALVYQVALELTACRRAALLSAAWLLVNQSAVIAVASNDTLSQVLGSAAGNLALWLAWRGLHGRRGAFLGCVAAAAVAFWSKETSLSFLPALALLCALGWHQAEPARSRRAGAALVAAAGLALVYLLLRAHITAVGPSLGDTPTNLRLGLNVPRNLGALLGVGIEPVSTVSIFHLLAGGSRLGLVACGLLAGLVVTLAIAGWRRRGQGPLAAALTALAVATVSVPLLLNHVSELYAYNALPLVSLLLGVGLATWLERGRWAWVLAGVLLLTHAVGAETKLLRMRANGERATALIAELAPQVRALPPGGAVVLVQPRRAEPRPRYSVFELEDWDLLEHGTWGVQFAAGRPDVSVRIVEPGEAAATIQADALPLTLQDGRVVPYKESSAPR